MLETNPDLHIQIEHSLNKVNAIINHKLCSDVPLISQIGHYIVSSGGKRMRPVLTIFAGNALNYDQDDLYSLATMVEFIHTSTLLHDDVVDESQLRRGRKTANHLYGNPAAVLVGDFLFSRAFELMVATNNMRIMDVMAKASNVIAEGEVMQLLNIGNCEISCEAYFQVIQCKTAKLFEASTQAAAILANASPSEEKALADYGMYLGTAFQIIDDLLDYTGQPEQTGKNVGNDLAEGKPTLPLIYAMEHASANEAEIIKQALQQSNDNYFNEILDIIRHSGAFAYVTEEAKKNSALAINALSALKYNKFVEYMIELARFSVSRLN